MKCFERLIMAHINTIIPETVDPLQFAYRTKKSTDDTISIALHTALSHLDKTNTYRRRLFIDFAETWSCSWVTGCTCATSLPTLATGFLGCCHGARHTAVSHLYHLPISLWDRPSLHATRNGPPSANELRRLPNGWYLLAMVAETEAIAMPTSLNPISPILTTQAYPWVDPANCILFHTRIINHSLTLQLFSLCKTLT